MSRAGIAVGVLGVALVAGGAAWAVDSGGDYEFSAVLPNAGNLFEGSSVMYDGYEAGSVEEIDVKDGKALITMKLDKDYAPLHDGAKAEIVWKASLGERLVRITDGDDKNAELPDGAMLEGVQREPVELDAVLSALDTPTRKHLSSLVNQLEATLKGREQDANDSLKTAGPALEQLGAVLREVSTDGEAIKQIITQFSETMSILDSRGTNLDDIVTSLASATNTIAAQDKTLGDTLKKLPPVLQKANSTLGRVPGTVDKSLPLLNDLAPATGNLKSVAVNLRPLLQDLRPAVADLRPTLNSLSELLGITPGLLDNSTDLAPKADDALGTANPMINFLRPYTPSLAGWATNWGSATASKDPQGRYIRFLVETGLEGQTLAKITGPGVKQDLTPDPGNAASQPWTDANGSGMR